VKRNYLAKILILFGGGIVLWEITSYLISPVPSVFEQYMALKWAQHDFMKVVPRKDANYLEYFPLFLGLILIFIGIIMLKKTNIRSPTG